MYMANNAAQLILDTQITHNKLNRWSENWKIRINGGKTSKITINCENSDIAPLTLGDEICVWRSQRKLLAL